MPDLSWPQRAVSLAALTTISAAAVTVFGSTSSAGIKSSQSAEHNKNRPNQASVLHEVTPNGALAVAAIAIPAPAPTCPAGQMVTRHAGQPACQARPEPHVPKHRRPLAPKAEPAPVRAVPVVTTAPAPARTPAQAPAPAPAHTEVAAATSTGDPKAYAESLVGAAQFSCLDQLWEHESGWSVTAENPSGAYGIPQSLPGSKMAAAGPDWETNPITQIKWGIQYLDDTYGSPCAGWAHEQNYGWY